MRNTKVTEWTPADPEVARTLPSKYYFDADIFGREAETIVYPSWHCACHVSEIPNKGDFVVLDVLDQSVIVMRGEAGVIHAHHNVCQHRGTRLIQERRGNVKKLIVCPYHCWSYGHDGRLKNAPRTQNLAGFDKADYSLKSVRVEVYASFVHINMNPDAQPLADQVRGAEETMREYLPDLDDVELVNETDYIVDANWKVIIDNAIEGYHFKLSGPVHRELAALIDFDGYQMIERGLWWDYKGPPVETETAFGHPVAGQTYQTNWFYNIQLWPMTTIYAFPYADVIGTFNQLPLGPEKTLLRLGHYCPKGRPQSDLSNAVVDWFNNQLGPEDIDLNLALQKGVRSFGFDQGRYMIDAERSANSEHLLHHFHTLIYRALNGEPLITAQAAE